MKRPVGRPPKHGAYSKFALMPLTQQKEQTIMEVLKDGKSLVSSQDAIIIQLLARTLAQIQLMDRWLAEHGVFMDTERGVPQPVLPLYWTAIKVAANLCNQLGLTPQARIKLGIGVAQAEDLALRILRVKGL